MTKIYILTKYGIINNIRISKKGVWEVSVQMYIHKIESIEESLNLKKSISNVFSLRDSNGLLCGAIRRDGR
jgi:hypothetical protein